MPHTISHDRASRKQTVVVANTDTNYQPPIADSDAVITVVARAKDIAVDDNVAGIPAIRTGGRGVIGGGRFHPELDGEGVAEIDRV